MDKAQEVARGIAETVHRSAWHATYCESKDCLDCESLVGLITPILRDHGVGSEQATALISDRQPTEDEIKRGMELEPYAKKCLEYNDLRRQLAEREAVREKVRKMLDKRLPHSGACLDQNPDGTFNGKIKCRCSKEDQELREALASPSTILSAHDAEVRRETIEECREFMLRGAEQIIWNAHRYLKRTRTYRGKELIESLMILAHCGFTIEKERAALRSQKEEE